MFNASSVMVLRIHYFVFSRVHTCEHHLNNGGGHNIILILDAKLQEADTKPPGLLRHKACYHEGNIVLPNFSLSDGAIQLKNQPTSLYRLVLQYYWLHS